MTEYKTQNDGLYQFFPYENEPKHEPLYIQQFGDIIGIIMNLGTHPCSYIVFPAHRYAIYSSIINSNDLKVHGGITYRSNTLNLGHGMSINGYILGWDYAHGGDYSIYTKTGKKYTKLNLISELVDACFDIQEMEEIFDA